MVWTLGVARSAFSNRALRDTCICGAGTHPSTVFVVKTVLRKRLVLSHSFVLRTLLTMFEVSGLCLVSNGFAMDDCFHF